MERKPVIAGNWKMNTTPSEGVRLVSELKERLGGFDGAEVIVAPPYTHLHPVGEAIRNSGIKLSSQNVYSKDSGAFTGEISPSMLEALGCEFAIIGHSERRQYFGETDESVNEKVHAVLDHGIIPIVCVGETLAERESGKTLDIIQKQIRAGLKGLPESGFQDIIIAYEPVWAIGTGKTATDAQAQEVHADIRKNLEAMLGKEAASKTRILYGGSVKPDNIDGLMAQPDIDGALVGGASLEAQSFERIVKFERV